MAATTLLLPILGALVLGVTVGWWLARRQGERELEAYRLGMEDTLRNRGGQCWVKTQIPPNSM
jgi:hypothetical protein